MLRLHTLGQVFLEREGARVLGAAAQPRRLAVLAVLAAAGTRGVSRERLLALLWTDTEEERARKGLNQALYSLRQEIGSDDAITGIRDLAIAPELVRTDVGEFRAAVAAGNFERAVSVYDGPFLDGFHLPGQSEFERWMELERARLARDYATSLERLACQAEERGDHGAAVVWWRRLAAVDPLDGKTTLRLMEALVSAGDRVGALKHARIYEVLLSQELELPPDRDVLALAERIRQMDDEPSPARETPAVDEPTEPAPAPIRTLPTTGPAPAMEKARRSRARLVSRRWALRWLIGVGISSIAITFVAVRSRIDTGSPELGAARKITFDAGLELDPALSPDGSSIAYAAGSEGSMRIFVRRVDGGRAVRVSGDVAGDHRRPRWSPDGSRLLFQASGAIWLVPALGGATRPVVSMPGARALYPDWSPTGEDIVWVQRDSILVRSLGGGDTRLIAMLPEAHSLSWSPDGRWIAAVSGNEGFVYGAGSSTMQVGFISIGNLAPSSVWLIPARGGRPTRVAGGDHLHTSPEWLAANRLVFVSDYDGARDLFVATINSSGKLSGQLVRLTTGLGAHTVSAQRNGLALAYSVYTQSSNVWALSIPAGDPIGTSGTIPITRGTQTVEGLEVSPDGRWLAFDADGGGSQDIYRLPLAGGDIERVVESPTNDHRPSWSPDGRWLLFYSFVDGIRQAFVVPADGGRPRPLQPGGREEQHTPVWSADMRSVLFHRWIGDFDQIFEMTRANDSTWSAERQITRHGGFGPRWSSDGKHLAYVARRQVRLMGPGPDREATSRVLYDFSDTSATTPKPVALRWSPDGRILYMKTFNARGDAALWALGVDGGPPRLLVRFDEPLRPTRRPEFATDGKRFYFTLAQSESDVWIIGVRTE